MKKLVACVVFALVAGCGGGSKKSSTTADPNDPSLAAGEADPAVDPTVPSWTPQSCKDYHKAVYQAVECDALEQAKRDEIKAGYDTAASTWKAETNATEAKIGEFAASCTQSTETVRAAIGSLCVPPAK